MKWQPLDKNRPLSKEAEDMLVLFDTGEWRRYMEEDLPAAIITHFMIVPSVDESPSPVSVKGMEEGEMAAYGFISNAVATSLKQGGRFLFELPFTLYRDVAYLMNEYASITNQKRDTRIKELEGEVEYLKIEELGYKQRIAELEKEIAERDKVVQKLSNTLKSLPIAIGSECEDYLQQLEKFYNL
jgi:uncharacterized coiled-coil protein SlyX